MLTLVNWRPKTTTFHSQESWIFGMALMLYFEQFASIMSSLDVQKLFASSQAFVFRREEGCHKCLYGPHTIRCVWLFPQIKTVDVFIAVQKQARRKESSPYHFSWRRLSMLSDGSIAKGQVFFLNTNPYICWLYLKIWICKYHIGASTVTKNCRTVSPYRPVSTVFYKGTGALKEK